MNKNSGLVVDVSSVRVPRDRRRKGGVLSGDSLERALDVEGKVDPGERSSALASRFSCRSSEVEPNSVSSMPGRFSVPVSILISMAPPESRIVKCCVPSLLPLTFFYIRCMR